MAQKPKATPRVGGEATSLDLEKSLAAGLSSSRPLSAWFHGPEGMVLLQEPLGFAGFLAGTLGTLSVEEVFAHVLTGIRSGLLAVQHGAVRRTVSFRDGQVVFATSTERWERLGAVLVRLGLVTQAQLTQALSRVMPSRRIGQVLTSEGLVSEAHLYSAMTYVVREVVLSLFELTEGSFLFVEGPAPMADVVKLPERTRDLVLTGIKRSEELSRWRRRYPEDMRAETGPKGPRPGEERLFRLLGTGTTLGELRTVRESGHHAFFAWLEECVQGGHLTVRPATPPAPPVPAVEGMAWELLSAEERYNLLLSLIHRALRDAGEDVDLLRGFLDAPPSGLEDAYAGVVLSAEGRVDVARLRANLSGGGEAVARALTLEALDAIVSYALFSARNVLPSEVAERLSNTYRTLQGGLA
ncbi:DUF4388 domain-containing protein [Myxococcus llanfairpwllgwyngyllgogerychwyrndrobwllllantysiliogogogochensis]|uniref:DUF4388 domain-containing protein n=1 Tax=Myxococcus llanfairpwllgwyngyllgogerychwyrndrobwllllantysiliogogogochensis TaxID=2590453 RepID=A0A540X0P3_9BACT|nr:DUF4388 domain-containing protein [Myxococcus llanfairpwllgwyngyllgogerychwyrndrobwllllantysiliogogogochensis]TQF14805.1 DUF4388 domain-containing protein [Myxococcus llanfairpwllgwyngyllgogerychwyrndrobwllllantysiliogogogochensis]